MEPVQLLVYDLSQGMARMMSMPLTGRQINGIWHTSIVVYGKEYCFGQGIQVFNPQQTPYGVPVERISMGTTQIPKLVFLEYIETLKTIWTADKYHLLDNNCNSFTDEVCQFLVGSGIPKHITGLPTEFLNTPFGQQIRPMIENMFGTSRHSPAVSMNNISDIPKQVISCTNLSRLLEIIRSNRCVAIDFTSKMCGPCRIISPEFEKILEVVNAKSEKVVGIAVEIDVARDIANHYEINSTPTFMFFLDGKKFSEFRGANVAELKSSIEFLIYTANPPHPNSRLNLQNLVRLSKSSCVHFTLSSDLDKIFAKLEESVAKQGLQADLVGLKKWVLEHDLKKTESLPRQWMDVKRLLGSLTPVSLFPLLDILRLIVQNPIAARYFVYEDTDMIFIKVIKRCLAQDAGMPTKLMLLKFVSFINVDLQFI
jgi:thiol-disulfide isomerase/thioredoxin